MLAFSCSHAFGGSLTCNMEAMEGVDGATHNRRDLFGQGSCVCQWKELSFRCATDLNCMYHSKSHKKNFFRKLPIDNPSLP